MVERSLPWDGTVTGDAGTYSPLDFTDSLRDILFSKYSVVNAVQQNRQGIIEGIGDELQVQCISGNTIQVSSGDALVGGTYYRNTVAKQLTIVTPTANPKIDTVVLEKSYPSRTTRIKIVHGAESATPSRPTLLNIEGNVSQIPLADAYITTGGVVIIADRRQLARTPLSPPGSIQHIETITLTNVNQIFVFDSIPNKYKSLLLMGSIEQSGIARLGIRINNITSSNYETISMGGSGAGTTTISFSGQDTVVIPDAGGGGQANEKIHIKTIIPFYKQTTFEKQIVSSYMAQSVLAPQQDMGIISGMVEDTDEVALSSLEIFLVASSLIEFVVGSELSLYGIV